MHHMTKTTEPTPQEAAARFSIDSAASRFTLQAFAGGLLSAFGHDPVISIPDFFGEIQIESPDLARVDFRLTINAASLQVASEMPDKDRAEIERVMHQQVLEDDRYPEIIYECSQVSSSRTGEGQYWVALNGQLTMHGVSHAQTISTRVSMNGDKLKAAGNFSLLQSDYEIERVSFAGGTLRVKDELKCAFSLVANRQV